MTKLLVASGRGFLTSVEIINLDGSSPEQTCDNLPDLLIGLEGSTGQLYQGSRPIICGGGISSTSWSDYCDCYEYGDQKWKAIASLVECKRYPSSAVFSAPNNKDEILLLSGGAQGSQTLTTVEAFNGSSWSQEMFTALPENNCEHCLVKLNSSHLFLIGGYGFANGVTRSHFHQPFTCSFFLMEMLCTGFMYLKFVYIFFGKRKLSIAAGKMLLKLTTGIHISSTSLRISGLRDLP